MDLAYLYSNVTALAFLAVAILAIHVVATCVQRYYFHPLSKFPGPWLASVTKWYEGYHEVVLGGTFVHKYEQWHHRYGPIIRIAPNHLHISEPSFYDVAFGARTAFLKDPDFYGRLGVPQSLPGILDQHVHRSHRNVLNPIFSKSSIAKKFFIVSEKVDRAIHFIERQCHKSNPIDIELLFRRVSMDIASRTLFGYSFNLIEGDEEDPPQLQMLAGFVQESGVIKHFPVLKPLSKALPSFLNPLSLEGYRDLQMECAGKIASIKADQKNGVFNSDPHSKTVFDVVLENNDAKGFERLKDAELIDEAHLFLVAGVGSVSYTLASGVYYLLDNPSVLRKLVAELDSTLLQCSAEQFDWQTLSKLPYLTVVVREILRLSTAIPGNLPRVIPPSGAEVCGNFIPPGTVISMSNHVMHHNAALFDRPMEFLPERWLGSGWKECERWHVSFSRGPRRCIGMNLAYLEMHTLIAKLFVNFDFKLFETDQESMIWKDKGIAARSSTIKVRAHRRYSVQKD